MQGKLPFIMEHGSIELRGEAYLTLAKSKLSIVNANGDENANDISKILSLLEKASEMYISLEALQPLMEIYYLQVSIVLFL